MRNVMLVGGIYHPFDEYAEEITSLCTEIGVDTIVTDDVEAAIGQLEGAALFTLYALRWRMLNHEKYIPHRPRWAFEMPQALADTLRSYVANGGPMLAMHTASICFDDWPGFAQVLGGQWVWNTSFHPEPGAVDVIPAGEHPIVSGSDRFTLSDEVYHNLALEPGSTPLLQARVPDGDWQTVAWAYEGGGGRVVYDALGHDGASLRDTAHRAFLRSSLRWLMQH